MSTEKSDNRYKILVLNQALLNSQASKVKIFPVIRMCSKQRRQKAAHSHSPSSSAREYPIPNSVQDLGAAQRLKWVANE